VWEKLASGAGTAAILLVAALEVGKWYSIFCSQAME